MSSSLAHSTARSTAVTSTVRNGIAALLITALYSVAAQADSIALSARSPVLNVAVIGDSVANDLGRGMEALFGDKPNVHVIKQTRFATGLVRTDYFDWNDTVRDFLKHSSPDVIIVVMGGNDRQPIRAGGRRLDPLSRPWLVEYDKRVAHFMNTVKRSRARVYWVGLPAVRSGKMTADYRVMNGIYRREALRHGFKYISVWSKFRTPAGAYSSFGQSLEGVKRQLRMDDGMHFTGAGRLLLAHHVARAIGLR